MIDIKIHESFDNGRFDQSRKLNLTGNCVTSSAKNRVFRPLPEKFFIPMITATTARPGTALLVEIYDGKIIQSHLLWKLLFRGCTVLDWYILQHKLESMKILEEDKNKVKCLTLLLYFSADTRKRLVDWHSKTKPIHKKLASLIPKQDSVLEPDYDNFLQYILKKLKIPNKGFDSEHLYRKSIISIPKKHLQEELYVGVGYKDKGTLSEPRVEPPISAKELSRPQKVNPVSIERSIHSLFDHWTY